MKAWLPLLFLSVACLAGCDGCSKKPTGAPDASADAGHDAGPPRKDNVVLLTTWGKDVGLKNPAGVFHDEQADVYFVSNANGKPLEADNNGFISRLAPSAIGVVTKWIEGGKKDVTLNSPKGMAVTPDGALWVADIDTVRLFDRRTGEPKGTIPIPGATSLDDIVVAGDGRILVSDTGLKAGKDGALEPTDNDAIYAIAKDKTVSTFAKTKDLKKPKGLLALDGKLWVASYGANVIFPLDATGAKGDELRMPVGKLDGLTASANGDLWVSSWESNAVYRGKPGGLFQIAIDNVKGPGEIAFDQKRERILVPISEANEVRAYVMR